MKVKRFCFFINETIKELKYIIKELSFDPNENFTTIMFSNRKSMGKLKLT